MGNAKALLEDLATAVLPDTYSQEEMETDVTGGRERLTMLVQDALGSASSVGEINIAFLRDAATMLPTMWDKKILGIIDDVVRSCGGFVDRTYTVSWQQTAFSARVPGFSPMAVFKKIGSEEDRVLPAEQQKMAPASLLLAGLNELPSPSMVDLVFIVSNMNLGDDPEDLKSELRRFRDKVIYIYVGTGSPYSEVLDSCHPGWKRQTVKAKALIQSA
jgi:hypothetical protein